jgi:tellurite resistance protein TerC
MTRGYVGSQLSVRENGKRLYTPLFVVVLMIGITDVIFAVDSIPAIFAITKDPFVVLTSNVFAVLGLRALFFLLAGMADRFHLLGHGLAAVLLFIGAKMLLAGVFAIPIGIALGIVALLIAASIVASLLLPPHVHGAD